MSSSEELISAASRHHSAADAMVPNGSGMLDASRHGVVADGQSGDYSVTYRAGDTILSLFTISARVTVTNVDGQAQISYPAFPNEAVPRMSDIGLNCHVPGAGIRGGDFVSHITGFYNSHNREITLILSDPAPTTFADVETRLTWPCFASSAWRSGNPAWSGGDDVGKWLRMSEGQTTHGAWRLASAVYNYQAPLFGMIGAVRAPNEVMLVFPKGQSSLGFAWPVHFGFGFSVTDAPGATVDWGTENSGALLAACTAAARLGIKDIWFPGPASAIVFALGFYTTTHSGIAPFRFDEMNHNDLPPALIPAFTSLTDAKSMTFIPLFHNNRFLSDGVRGRFFSLGGGEIAKTICPRGGPPPVPPRRKIKGTRHLPRLGSLAAGSVATVVTWSASIYQTNPTGEGQSLMADAINTFMRALREANGGRLTFHKVDRSIGGEKMTNLDSIPVTFPRWYNDAAKPWLHYVSPVPGIDGSEVTPDLILLFEDGSNPKWFEDAPALLSILRSKIASLPRRNGHPPDVLMCNCRSVSHTGYTNPGPSFNGGMWCAQSEGSEFAATFLETMADHLGIGFLDLFHPSSVLHNGWSARALSTRRVAAPPSSTTVTPSSPLDLRYQRVRDYSLWLTINAPDGASAFMTGPSAVGRLRFQLSPRPNNELIVGTDQATGNLTVMAVSYGRWMNDEVSLDAETGVLRCGGVGQRIMTDVSWYGADTLVARGNHFSIADVGSAMLINRGGWNDAPFITAVSDFYMENMVGLADSLTYHRLGLQEADTLTVGGGIFIPKDADAGHDILIFQEGNVLSGRITGYTSQGQVTTSILGTALSDAPATIFTGHLSVPWTVTGQNVSRDPNANPTLVFSKQYNKIALAYLSGPELPRNAYVPDTFWSDNVVIWGGAYCPKIFVTNPGPCSLTPSFLRLDRKILFTPGVTDLEFWGPGTGDSDDSGNHVHPSSRQLILLDENVLSFQDLSVI